MIAALPPITRRRIESLLATVARDEKVLAGISGGRDSMVLLHLLKALGFQRIVVAHLNHGLRGAASEGDADFVQAAAARLGCAYVGEKCDPPGNANGAGMEADARAIRFAFFRRADPDARVLFLGHHADDRAETLLHHLLRGSGMRGLSSLRADMTMQFAAGDLRVLRPLLWLHRSQIDALAHQLGIENREDATNTDSAFTRNRLRHEVLPYLEKVYGRDVRASLARTAAILEAEEDWMDSQTDSVNSNDLDVARLLAMSLALRRRVLRAWLAHHAVPDVSFELVEAIDQLLLHRAPARTNLPGGRYVRRRAGRLFIENA